MAKIQITKDNWRKFTKSALMPGRENIKPLTYNEQKELSKNVQLLQDCERLYSSLQDFRDRSEQCDSYYLGDQLSQLVPDPDDENGRLITIRAYAIKQGMTPLTMNLITSRIRQMVGVYEKQKLEDLVLSRAKDEERLGEMMSVAMQYVYQNENLYRANADGYSEFLRSGLPIFRTGYDFNSEKKFSDVYCDLEDRNYMFWDNNTSGRYFKNISVIGKLHEFSLLEILGKFAKTPAMRKQIINAYGEVNVLYPSRQQFERVLTKKKVSFYEPTDLNKYRVIEVWRKEEHEVYVCHDPLEDEPYIVNVSQLDEILAENSNRKAQISLYGGDPDDAATIDFEYRVDTEWVVRYLTPCGHVLYQAVSPYKHGSHPWALGGYPMIGGRVQSLVSDLIPAQNMVNRLVMRMEFIRMNQAKGFGIVDLDALENSNLTVEEFAKQYTSAKGIAALRCKDIQGGVNNVFARFTDEGGTNSDMEMLNTYIQMINQQSGSTDAARGEKGGSHESASRYMMETENSNNNTCDGEQFYNGIILARDNKIMQLMQQYYTGVRYMNIAGHEYSEESKFYDSDKIRQTLFDLSIIQNPSTGVVRMMMSDTLNNLLQAGAIDGDTLLECSPEFGAEKIMRIKKRNEEKRMQEQQAMQQQAAEQQQAAAALQQAQQPVQQ